MAKLSQKDFMDKLKVYIGDKDDDDTLQFLADVKDTITEDKNDYKKMYENAVKEKETLDKDWRAKFKEAFYSSEPISNNNNNNDNTHNDPNFDNRTEEQKQAEEISIDDLFKPTD